MPTETLYVSGYSQVNREWDESGGSPWLDDDNDNIYTSVDEELHDEFTYEDSVNTDKTLQSVVAYFEVNGPSARNDEFVPYIWDGSWQELTAIDPDADGYQWYNEDISSILDTWAKVQAAKLRCRYNRAGSPATQTIYVRRAYLLITYAAAETPKDFSDTMGLSDAFTIVYKELGFADSFGMSDAFAIVLKALGFSDTLGMSDAWAKSISVAKAFADSIGLSDAFGIVYKELGFADAISMADVFALVYKELGFSDTATLADAFTIVYKELGFVESFSLADAWAKAIIGEYVAKAFADAFVLLDEFRPPTISSVISCTPPTRKLDKAIVGSCRAGYTRAGVLLPLWDRFERRLLPSLRKPSGFEPAIVGSCRVGYVRAGVKLPLFEAIKKRLAKA